MDISQLQSEIAKQRRSLEALEQQLTSVSGEAPKTWTASGFYTSYYMIAGLILGALAAWVSLVFNVAGALIAFGDPFRLLRIYATFFGGEAILQSSQSGVAILLALILHSATGAVVGAPIHIIYSRYVAGAPLQRRLATGVALGIIMWLVNFYGILSWLQPMVSGGNQIVTMIPVWVAALTHICFTLTMLVLQPYWAFDPRRLQQRGGAGESVATGS